MLSVKKLIDSALECLGWPYESPGTNDKNGIDCSGLWVKCFRDQGAKIYHGSNTIFRDYCTKTEKLTSVNQLKPGMAVFKLKAWTEADKGNKWYGKAPGNLSHIGMVTSTNPLVITHATSPVCKQDFALGKWAYCGYVKDVDYEGGVPVDPDPTPDPDPEPTPTPETKTMYVYAENGKPVNMRTKPDIHSALVEKVPVGASVIWQKENGAGWAYVKYHGFKGWMLDCFLVEDPPGSTPDPDPEPSPAPDPEPEPDPDPDDDPTGEMLSVWAENGKPVKLRAKPSTSCKLYDEVPCNEEVELVKYGEEWCKVNYKTRNGWYMMTKFLGRG